MGEGAHAVCQRNGTPCGVVIRMKLRRIENRNGQRSSGKSETYFGGLVYEINDKFCLFDRLFERAYEGLVIACADAASSTALSTESWIGPGPLFLFLQCCGESDPNRFKGVTFT